MRAMTPRQLAAVYDVRAAIPFDGATNEGETQEALKIFEALAPARDSRILDIGCGAGWFLRALSNEGYRNIYGMDFSVKSLRRAAENCAERSTILILGDIATTRLQDFDVATALNASLGSFGAVGDQRYINGIFRTLRPGGQLLLSYVGPEQARRRLGVFRARYSAASPVEVSSQVRISSDWLEINQQNEDRPIPEERIRILEVGEVERMLSDAGFASAIPLATPEVTSALPYVSVVVATKPQ